ncbi:hypothetical protein U9M48_000170 [Paspalum notatum var. saurae]|uniref:Uncharacterized protein n=1 Tax=Paspalum notatum var. saurae TaxID=547442 RepID=A0AAQ3PL75_PASNO
MAGDTLALPPLFIIAAIDILLPGPGRGSSPLIRPLLASENELRPEVVERSTLRRLRLELLEESSFLPRRPPKDLLLLILGAAMPPMGAGPRKRSQERRCGSSAAAERA